MSDLFVLYGKLEADTAQFQKVLRESEARLDSVGDQIDSVENKSKSLGNSTATSARGFDKLREKVTDARSKLLVTAEAFSKNEATAKQMRAAILNVESATGRLVSKLKDSSAGLTDIARKSSTVSTSLNDAARKSSGARDFLGSALGGSMVGSFFGASAAVALGGAVNELAGDLKDLGLEAVHLAGDFEVTTNSMAVFTGSIPSARKELAHLDDIAANTPGLRLKDAEEGATRLRALGFEAETTEDLIVGLSKHKILSGADESAMQRVIVNLTQLSAGSTRVNSDVKEMIMAMPTLRNAIISTFGSIDKFKAALQNNPDAAFKKLAEGLASTKTAAGGLNDAAGKLEDAWTQAKRSFAEPLLPELTEDLKAFTAYIQGNKETWREWGDYAVDVIQGVKNAAKEAGEFKAVQQGGDVAGFVLGNMSIFGAIKRIGDGFAQSGEKTRKESSSKKTQESFKGAKKWLDNISGEVQAERAAAEQKQARLDEIARQKQLNNLETWKSANDAIYDSFYSGQEAKLSSYLTNSVSEEKKQISDIASLRADRFKSDLSRTKNYYDKLIGLADGDKDEIAKLEADKAQAVAKINADFTKDSYATQKKLAEIERSSYNDRLKEAINFKRQIVDELDFNLDVSQFNFGESLKNSPFLQRENFDEMIRLTNESFKEVLRITRESYADQLNEIGISEERKKNIRAEGALAEKKLAEQNMRDILRIEEDKRNRIAQFYSDLYGAVASGEQQKAQRKTTFLESVFGINNLSSSQINKTAELIKNKTSEIDKAQEDYRAADRKRLDAELASLKYDEYINQRRNAFISDKTETVLSLQPEEITKQALLKEAFKEAREESSRLYSSLESLRGGVSDYYEDFGSFRKLITQNLGDETIFDQVSAKTLEMEKTASLSALDAKIEQARKLVESKPGDPKESLNLQSLLNERGNLAAEYFRKEQEQRSKSITGLREYISLLQNGDPVATAVIQHQNLTNALREQAAAQEALVGKWSFSIDEVNAKLMSAAAGQQGLNDTIVNGILGVSDALGRAVVEWDGTLSGFFESLSSAFKDMVKQIIAEMIRLLIIATAMGIITSLSGGSFSDGFGKVMKKDGDSGGWFGGLFGKKTSGDEVSYQGGDVIRGFLGGGYTGNGKTTGVAGVVHGKEFVFDAQSTRAIGVNNLAAMQANRSLLSAPSPMGGGSSKTVNVNQTFNFPNVTNSTKKEEFQRSATQLFRDAMKPIQKAAMEND